MTEVQQKPTLVFNDKNYVIEDLSEKSQYLIAQLQDLNAQKAQTSARLDQISVGIDGFTGLLTKELEESEEVEEEEGAE
tara:strand:+ start:279 stop:515 length:237 start_codon:yes stop_codon:yes gene_type:complete